MIIITVPHAMPHFDVGRDEIGMPTEDALHVCDWIAERGARQLHGLLPGSILIVGDVNRRVSDLNRKESRMTKFRKNLRKIIKTNPGPHLIIDMHSADSNFFGDTDLTLVQTNPRSWADYEIAAYTQGKAHLREPKIMENYVASFMEQMKYDGVSANIFCSWPPTVDLIGEMKELGNAAILVELNEEIAKTDPSYFDRVCNSMAKWASNF